MILKLGGENKIKDIEVVITTLFHLEVKVKKKTSQITKA